MRDLNGSLPLTKECACDAGAVHAPTSRPAYCGAEFCQRPRCSVQLINARCAGQCAAAAGQTDGGCGHQVIPEWCCSASVIATHAWMCMCSASRLHRRQLHNELQNIKGAIRVFCRVRPSSSSSRSTAVVSSTAAGSSWSTSQATPAPLMLTLQSGAGSTAPAPVCDMECSDTLDDTVPRYPRYCLVQLSLCIPVRLTLHCCTYCAGIRFEAAT